MQEQIKQKNKMPVKQSNVEKHAQIELYKQYRNGGDGFCKWVEDNVCMPIYPIGSAFSMWVPVKDLPKENHPDTGRSYFEMWSKQKEILKQALVMKNGQFVHRLIAFIWPRGEGKSVLANLIQMWKFFCWPKQTIILCSNSRDQSSFLQYNEIKSIIENSPKLLKIVGKKNVQAGEIRRRDTKGDIVSVMQSVSSYSGIFSNINGYAFSEFFECKREDFFVKVDGSIRNVPNALGVIDSTVSSKVHTLYKLRQSYKKKEDPQLFVSYRCSKDGDYKDYWNPYMTHAQLTSYKVKYSLGEFARYFLNLWSAGAERVFSEEQIAAVNYIGADHSANTHKQVVELVRKKTRIIDTDRKLRDIGVDAYEPDQELDNIERRLWPVSKVYSLQTDNGLPTIAGVDALDRLTEIYDTYWSIHGGLDRADPMKRRTSARSVFMVIAKGLPGSRSNPQIGVLAKQDYDKREIFAHAKDVEEIKPDLRMPTLDYIYFILYLVNIEDHSLEQFKFHISLAHEEFDGIDTIGSERYGAWDLVPWGQDKNIKFDVFHPTYGIQLSYFSYLYNLMNKGRIKSPPIAVTGSKYEDVLKEELSFFDHDIDTKWFGSPEKKAKEGVQDDVMFALGGAIYGSRFTSVDDFRERSGTRYWGTIQQPKGLMGRWGI